MNPSLPHHLSYLRLGYIAGHYEALAAQAAEKDWPPLEYLQRLIEGEYHVRQERALERRVRAARFPVIKTLDQFRWDWPKKIDELKVKNLFRLGFVEKKTNVIFCGGVGLGKSHLAAALAYEACQRGRSVLFTTAVDALNNLTAAQAAHRLKFELKKYLSPDVVLLDEVRTSTTDVHEHDHAVNFSPHRPSLPVQTDAGNRSSSVSSRRLNGGQPGSPLSGLSRFQVVNHAPHAVPLATPHDLRRRCAIEGRIGLLQPATRLIGLHDASKPVTYKVEFLTATPLVGSGCLIHPTSVFAPGVFR